MYIKIFCFQFLCIVASTTSSPGVAARCLACIADVLGTMAGDKGGLRSGPAANEAFQAAFNLLKVQSLMFMLLQFF